MHNVTAGSDKVDLKEQGVVIRLHKDQVDRVEPLQNGFVALQDDSPASSRVVSAQQPRRTSSPWSLTVCSIEPLLGRVTVQDMPLFAMWHNSTIMMHAWLLGKVDSHLMKT